MANFISIFVILVVLAIAIAETEIPRTTKLTTAKPMTSPVTHRTVPTRTAIPTITTAATQTTKIPTTRRPTITTKEPTTKIPTTTPPPTTLTTSLTTTNVTTDTPTTVTPDVITNPESTTSKHETTEFPIWTTTTTKKSTTASPSTTPSFTTQSPTATPSNGPTTTPTPTITSSSSTGTTSNSTITTPLPTPTLPPTPEAPSVPWNVSYPGKHGNFCIMAEFAARIDIVYENIDKEIVETGFDIPKNAMVNSSLSMCDPGALEEVLVLDFYSDSLGAGHFAAIFNRDNKTNESTLYELLISIPITENLFPGIDPSLLNKDKAIVMTVKNLSLFETDYYHSFMCKSLVKTNLSTIVVMDNEVDVHSLTNSDKTIFMNATLETRDLKLQTFMLSNRTITEFLLNELCDGDKPDTLWTVDFIVAGVMAVLVVFVLIGFFVGKRIQRNKMRNDILESALVNDDDNDE